MAVPTLNYSDFTSGTKEQREKFALELLRSFERSGFVKLRAHTFSAKELKELFTTVRRISIHLVVATTLTFFARATSFLTCHWM
jgi:isopenicillin N synthase-like dioxygenase